MRLSMSHVPFRQSQEYHPHASRALLTRRSADADDIYGFTYKNEEVVRAFGVGTLTAVGNTFEVCHSMKFGVLRL